ncbi:hypothetical protein BOTCAL_0050g00090 [Botryotinia calthae]|uniref:Uncharacterized protein n=1 Tax=Botryotinia calthae TaxID=38488 RepID=A0A4Y8DBF4_9HELO|nr:hypothetical protein BOTCAL_0050g00090 [Botryotinia calthae]
MVVQNQYYKERPLIHLIATSPTNFFKISHLQHSDSQTPAISHPKHQQSTKPRDTIDYEPESNFET